MHPAWARAARVASLALMPSAVLACGGEPPLLHLEDWIQVGVEPTVGADRVQQTLEDGGWVTRQRLEHEAFVALAFERGEEQRAVRIVTRRGVAVALDSHEPNGVLPRHGPVRLSSERPIRDVTGDGRDEILIARDEPDGSVCLAIVTVAEDGRAGTVPTEADAVAEGACPSSFDDVDGDGELEAMVLLRFPTLTLDEVAPSLVVPLVFDGEVFRASGVPVSFIESERNRRAEALVVARTRVDVPSVIRLAVELAALAQLGGAAPSAQVERFDDATLGMVLPAADVPRVDAIRSVIANGWPGPSD